MNWNNPDRLWHRRDLLKAIAATAIAAPAILAGEGASIAPRIIRIGYVSPLTGSLAGFGEADRFILDQVRNALAQGLAIGGVNYQVEIIQKDSQSNTSRAAEVALELIRREKVDLLLAAGTPDTTNPVADQAEANETLCLTTVAPWQSYFFGRNGNPAKGFTWTYHFFWGLEDVIAAFLTLWSSVETNRVVGGLFPNDGDGNAWSDIRIGFPPALKEAGFRLVEAGRFEPFVEDFTEQISAFKTAGVEIVTGVLAASDFALFWNQAFKQGFKPKVVTVGKALLFPSSVAAFGNRAEGLSVEIWWTPSHPFRSGLTGQSARELADAYVLATGRPWTQPIGFVHALFEVAIDVLKRVKNLDDSSSILEAMKTTDYRSVVGPLKWTGEPMKNIAKTPLVAGQWRKMDNVFELAVCENKTAPEIPVQEKLKLLS
jgi:branched-chain amino acid transport system substrate-binding protein